MKKAWLLIFSIYLVVFLLPIQTKSISAQATSETENLLENSYEEVLSNWVKEGIKDDIILNEEIPVFNFAELDKITINSEGEEVLLINDDNDILEFEYEVSSEGLYAINLEYIALTETYRNIEIYVEINNEIQYYESSSIVIPSYYETINEIEVDRYNNDIMPTVKLKYMTNDFTLRDTRRLYDDVLLFKFKQGINKIKIQRLNGDFYLKKITIKNKDKYLSYEAYLNNYNKNIPNQLYEIEAEEPVYKNSLSIRYGVNNELLVTPYHITRQKLNIIDGANYQKGGDALYYEIDALEEGLYYITLKQKQQKEFNISYRRVTINGVVPFEEANLVAFKHENNWKNYTLGNDQEKYLFYLNKGKNIIGLEVNLAPVRQINNDINRVMKGLNDLALDIKKLSGNYYDKNREWDILASLPNVVNELKSYKEDLNRALINYMEVHKTTKTGEVVAALKQSINVLDEFIKSPNTLPNKITKIAVDNNSITAKLGLIIPLITDSPLTLDKLYVHGDVELPQERANFFVKAWVGIKRFFLTFFNQEYTPKKEDGALEVWVNRSRQYVNVMQQMVDSEFTDMKVNISLMPSEDKLILAASAGNQPDVALGVAGWRPYDFAIREAVVDLTKFSDFNDVKERFYEGALLQLIYEDGVFGLPETQNFNLLFYRKDILNKLNIIVPDTWDEVIAILPELQRYGMNFYAPLSQVGAFKGFVSTMPFIKQFGGKLYNDDALSTAIDSEEVIKAMTLMTDLYTIYSLPLEVGSFYNSFRYGDIPIGVGDFGMYVQLLFAAPEIAGLWDIAPLPGVLNEYGIVDRSYDGASTSGIIFKNSNYQEEAWEFLKWWTKMETQLEYSENLISSMGPEYMWNTSNREAFLNYSWDENDKKVILKQWEWINDTEKTPAAYMLERELSNVWNKAVYNGVNVRTAIEDAVIVINKEITRKMIEFEYIDSKGNKLKEYKLPKKEK